MYGFLCESVCDCFEEDCYYVIGCFVMIIMMSKLKIILFVVCFLWNIKIFVLWDLLILDLL